MTEAKRKSSGAVDRALAMVEVMAMADQPLRLSDMAHQLDIPKSAAHRILGTLIDNGWARQNSESECYDLTLRMALIGQRQLRRLETVDLRQPILDDLAQRTKELVRLTTVQNGTLVWIGSSRGRRSGLVYEPDMNEKIIPFATANGKAWLAGMPREQALRIAIEADLGHAEIGTAKAIGTIEALAKELDMTSRRGYGLAHEEAEAGVGAMAVAIRVRGTIVGTMSVAAPLTRFSEERIAEVLPLLRAAADNMSIAWDAV
jgi:DNA-binding IclR family transcriptional regulator